MFRKIDLDKLCDKTEEENEKIKMQVLKKVIDEYSSFCNVDFRKQGKFADDYGVFDMLFQITTCQPQFFNGFHEILSKYGFNDKTYIEYTIKKITKSASNVENFVNGLIDAGLINEVYEHENNLICIKSMLGTYNFFLANEYYNQNNEIISYMENNETSRNCHVNTLFLLKSLKRGEAVTAKCSTMFNNTFYHSYYRYNEMICDLNINCVMNEKEYNELYNPSIISTVNINNLEGKQNIVKDKAKSTLEDLLEIAVYEEYLKK